MNNDHKKKVEKLETILKNTPKEIRHEANAIAMGLTRILSQKDGMQKMFGRLQNRPNAVRTTNELKKVAYDIFNDHDFNAPIVLL